MPALCLAQPGVSGSPAILPSFPAFSRLEKLSHLRAARYTAGMTESVRLARLPLRTPCSVSAVHGPRAVRRRLLELGLVPGTRVEVVGVSPLGDPLELEVRGSRLSIRKKEALTIEVRT
jgi:ferrous iron transport protein A